MPEITLENTIIFVLFVIIVATLLSVLSQKSKKYSSKYSEHFHQEKIATALNANDKSRKRISIKNYTLLAICCIVIILLIRYSSLGIGKRLIFMFAGIIISLLLFLLFIALRNFIIYRFIHNNPGSLSGKIILRRDYAIANYDSFAFSFSILFIFPFILYPSYFTFGMIIGPLFVLSVFKKGMGLK